MHQKSAPRASGGTKKETVREDEENDTGPGSSEAAGSESEGPDEAEPVVPKTLDFKSEFEGERPPGFPGSLWDRVLRGSRGYIGNANKEDADQTYLNLVQNTDKKAKPYFIKPITEATTPAQMVTALTIATAVKGAFRRDEEDRFPRAAFNSLVVALKAYTRRKGLASPFADVLGPHCPPLLEFLKGAGRAAADNKDWKYTPTRGEIEVAVKQSLADMPLVKSAMQATRKEDPPRERLNTMPVIKAAGSIRVAIILTCGYYGARRVSEIAELNWGDIARKKTGHTVVVRKSNCGQLGHEHISHIPDERGLEYALQLWGGFMTFQYGEDSTGFKMPVLVNTMGKNKVQRRGPKLAPRLVNKALVSRRKGQPSSLRRGGATHATVAAGSQVAVENGGWAGDKMLKERDAKQAHFEEESQRTLREIAKKELAADRVAALESTLVTQRDRKDGDTLRKLEECSYPCFDEVASRMTADKLAGETPVLRKYARKVRQTWKTERAIGTRKDLRERQGKPQAGVASLDRKAAEAITKAAQEALEPKSRGVGRTRPTPCGGRSSTHQGQGAAQMSATERLARLKAEADKARATASGVPTGVKRQMADQPKSSKKETLLPPRGGR